MQDAKTLVLGLGNDLVADDGFGPAVAEACSELFADRSDVRVETAALAGFNLLDVLAGHERVLVVDVVRTGAHHPGTLLSAHLGESPERGLGVRRSHGMDLESTCALGRMLDWPMPTQMVLLAVEGLDLETVGGGLTPMVAKAIPSATALVQRWIEEGTPPWRPMENDDERA